MSRHKDEALQAIAQALDDLNRPEGKSLVTFRIMAALAYAKDQIERIQELKRPRRAKEA